MKINWKYWLLLIIKYLIFGKALITDVEYYIKEAEITDLKGLDKRKWVVSQLMDKYENNPKMTNFLKDYKELVFAAIELLLKKL